VEKYVTKALMLKILRLRNLKDAMNGQLAMSISKEAALKEWLDLHEEVYRSLKEEE